MSMRISDAAILLISTLLVGGCGEQSGELPVEADAIACAIGEGAAMADGCTVERSTTNDGTLLTIRQPDGGFHRLRMATDGTIRSADGAEPAQATPVGDGRIDVTVGNARYRLPATTPPAS
jgi:hypothetical protein